MNPRTIRSEHAVAEQHRRLDAMFAEALAAMRESAAADAIGEAFGRLRDALEAHLAQEDRLYYPSLCALRPVHRPVLDALVGGARMASRCPARGDRSAMGRQDPGEAERALAAFCSRLCGRTKRPRKSC